MQIFIGSSPAEVDRSKLGQIGIAGILAVQYLAKKSSPRCP